MVRGIAHVCLRVADLERTRRFYCDGLGLERAFDFQRDGETIGFYLKAGNGGFVEFFRADAAPAGAFPLDHFCLEVDSIDVLRERLSAAGYPLGPKSLGADHAWQAWITDPDGARIEFHEYCADSCQNTGATCILK